MTTNRKVQVIKHFEVKKAKIETSSDLEKENLELKKRLREGALERDILKRRLLSSEIRQI